MNGHADGSTPLILDGALGTELERRGFDVKLPLWSAWALITAPELVRQVHADYVLAGAQVITAATFRTSRHCLFKEHLEDQASELTQLAVNLARDAAREFGEHLGGGDSDVKVAGSIAPLEDCYHPELAPDDETLAREHAHTARLLADAGADVLLVETQNSAREALIAAAAALKTSCPVWVSLMPRCASNLFNGDSLAETALTLHGMGVRMILVNCCPPVIADGALRTLRQALPAALLGAYPNFSSTEGEPWEYGHELLPADFAAWAKNLAAEAALLGGCCGTTPDHISALAAALKK